MVPAPEPNAFDVAWICPLKLEVDAARGAFTETYELDSQDYKTKYGLQSGIDSNIYYFGKIHQYNVVLCQPADGRAGPLPAFGAYKSLTYHFQKIVYLFLVGIAGGVPRISNDPDIRVGDVVLGLPSKGNAGVTQIDGGWQIGTTLPELTNALCTPHADLIRCAQQVIGNHETNKGDRADRLPQIVNQIRRDLPTGTVLRNGLTWEYPGPEQDVLFPPDYQCQSQTGVLHPEIRCPVTCDLSRQLRRPSRGSKAQTIHGGLVCSIGRVIKNGKYRDRIADQFYEERRQSQILCFEMEGSGIAESTQCLQVRGISDYSDAHKTKVWQPYAALQAAGVARLILDCVSESRHQVPRKRPSLSSLGGRESGRRTGEPDQTAPKTENQHIERIVSGPYTDMGKTCPESYKVGRTFPNNAIAHECEFKLYLSELDETHDPPRSHVKKYGPFKAQWIIRNCNLNSDVMSKQLSFRLEDSGHHIRFWVPVDGVTLIESDDAEDEYIYTWSDCESFDLKSRDYWKWPYFCYNASKPNIKLRIWFRDSQSITDMFWQRLDTNEHSAEREFRGSILNCNLNDSDWGLARDSSEDTLLDQDGRSLTFYYRNQTSSTTYLDNRTLIATYSDNGEGARLKLYRVKKVFNMSVDASAQSPTFIITDLEVLNYATKELEAEEDLRYQQQSAQGKPTSQKWASQEAHPFLSKKVEGPVPTIKLSYEALRVFLKVVIRWTPELFISRSSLRISSKFIGNVKEEDVSILFGFHSRSARWRLFCYATKPKKWYILEVATRQPQRCEDYQMKLRIEKSIALKTIDVEKLENLSKHATELTIDLRDGHEYDMVDAKLRNLPD